MTTADPRPSEVPTAVSADRLSSEVAALRFQGLSREHGR